MREVAARLRRRLREHGLRATLAKAFADHVYRTSDSVVVEYRRGWRAPPIAPTLPAGMTLATVRPGEPPPPLCPWLAWRAADFAAMLARGEIGVFLLDGGVAVGCAWMSLGDWRDDATGEHYPVATGEAYHYCWLLDPAMRRGNTGILLLRGAMVAMHAMGIERQFGVVDVVNRASYLLQYRHGYRECGRLVTHTTILGRRRTRMRTYTGTLGPAPAR